MKKLFITTGLFAALSLFPLTAEPAEVYISPNNDGVQDFLEIPLQIREKRYVSSWSLVITNDKGDVIREIGNKEKRPDRLTFKTFLKALITPKTGVTVPSSVIWNGVMDNGEVAPDGTYLYSFTATDDNGNSATTSKLSVIVDNTAPEVEIQQPNNDGKIFGEGAKARFTVKQEGSEEDLWTGVFTDATGKVVRTVKWSHSAPLKFDWSGADDNGVPVADGVYNYKITATDRAGNVSAPAGISNIIYSAEKPATSIAINGSRYFSPNGNGKNDTMELDVKIPAPDQSKTGNKLIGWYVKVVDKDGKVGRLYEGQDNPPSSVSFDGKDNNGVMLGEGLYQAVVGAKYLNGFETEPLKSPVFTLDVTPPSAKLTVSGAVFSPDGDGNLDTLTIKQVVAVNSGAPVENWKGSIIDENNSVVRNYDFGSFPSETIIWDGLDSNHNLREEGSYRYVLTASDLAGNESSFTTSSFKIDTSKTEILLTVKPQAFNPAGDKSQNTLNLIPVVKAGNSSVNHYDINILNSKGSIVWTSSADHALPAIISWNGLDNSGTRCEDGEYTAVLKTASVNGSEASTKTGTFIVDTVAPSINVEVPYTLFSPDGDGRKDVIAVKAKSSSEDKWVLTIYNDKNNAVSTTTWQGSVPESFEWDGTDSAGNVVTDGKYRMVFTSQDAAGNKASAEIAGIQSDTRESKAYVTADLDAFSPNGDSITDVQKFDIRTSLTDGIESWCFTIVSPEGKIARQWSSSDSKDVPASINWDGLDADGQVAEGVYTGKLNISYAKGNVVDTSSSAFICSITPPQLSVKTSPKYFSPDNDGEDDDLFIQLKGSSAVALKNWSLTICDPENGKTFWSTSGKATITERIIWDGRGNNGELVQSAMDYPYTFTATDTLGMTSTVEGKISVDVLVIRVGDVLKMAVPSIIFRSNAADFKSEKEVGKGGLTESQIQNNERVLKRIAQILNKFKNYTVTIEGHANNVSGSEAEETSTAGGNIPLVPLSQARAEYVMKVLKGYGVDINRLNAVGRGGRQPVAARSDKDNWWKNRRVEFILNK